MDKRYLQAAKAGAKQVAKAWREEQEANDRRRAISHFFSNAQWKAIEEKAEATGTTPEKLVAEAVDVYLGKS